MTDPKSSVGEISCPEVSALAFEYLDGEMPPHRRGVVTAHMARCQRCREHIERERSFLKGLRSCMAGEKCPDVVRERIREEMRKRSEAQAG